MKILFLAIDGILHPTTPGGGEFLDAPCGHLRRILKETGPKVVVADTWRKTERHLQSIKAALALSELPDTTPVFGMKPSAASKGGWAARHPADEINAYLAGATATDSELAQLVWLVIHHDLALGELGKSHVLFCHPGEGLTADIAENAIQHLNALSSEALAKEDARTHIFKKS